MLDDVVWAGTNSITRARSEGGLFYVETQFKDSDSLQRNRDIAASGMLEKAKLGLHDDEDMRMVISCPCTMQWSIFKRKHNDVYKMLTTRGHRTEDDALRMKGAKQLQILHPDWVVMERL